MAVILNFWVINLLIIYFKLSNVHISGPNYKDNIQLSTVVVLVVKVKKVQNAFIPTKNEEEEMNSNSILHVTQVKNQFPVWCLVHQICQFYE